ncbi:hypothetical protein M011DRAFT_489065 [Sporormia fimetaria CBS 119925]|uniref:G protein-coupled glucose receptor regulating Gpa2-domain-containing protein n=1 Tax=Sporormia fimetaria CBS 119925 TaxID=1340428 RepID=A0A6A6V2X4_9PLEO|nr:hypothetical protein M011DRAFT_489065 [Sporormia fimetaria CBS 119925]
MGTTTLGRSRTSTYSASALYIRLLFLLQLTVPIIVQAYPQSSQEAARVTGGGLRHATSDLYSNETRTLIIRAVAATCASISVTTSAVAFYWFCRMRKRFRHKLVMLLIYGDVMKASWLFIHAIVSISRGTVYTSSSFCQASGFLYQYGTETADLSVLSMAIHSALQVFRPSTSTRNDGLYPYRNYVYAATFIVPLIMSSLAFINPGWGYMSQGAFCSLPLRPFWYRLALNWVPRYVIASTILGLAIAIYAHVGSAFRRFDDVERGQKASISTLTSLDSTVDEEQGADVTPQVSQPGSRQDSIDATASEIASRSAQRRASVVASLVGTLATHPNTFEQTLHNTITTTTAHDAPRGARRPSVAFSIDLPPTASEPTPHPPPPSPTRSPSPHTPHPAPPPSTTSHTQSFTQRRRIHKQLRLIFIYPLLYILLWLIPFANHCLNYQDRYAARPVYWTSLLGTMCITSMGFVDSLVFTLRERPWRYIPDGGGTFWGSFGIGRNVMGRLSGEQDGEGRGSGNARFDSVTTTAGTGASGGRGTESEDGSTTTHSRALFSRNRWSVRTNGSSDQEQAAKEAARARLECEKEERRKETQGVGRGDWARASPFALGTIPSPGEEEIEGWGEMREGGGDEVGFGEDEGTWESVEGSNGSDSGSNSSCDADGTERI